MNATAMVGRLEETPPRLKARITGVLYLLTILTGMSPVIRAQCSALRTNVARHVN